MLEVGEEALDLLTVKAVAKRMSLSAATIWRLIYAEEKEPGTGLESVKVGRSRRVAPEAIVAYKARLRGNAQAGAA